MLGCQVHQVSTVGREGAPTDDTFYESDLQFDTSTTASGSHGMRRNQNNGFWPT